MGPQGIQGVKGDPGDVLYDMASYFPGKPPSSETVMRLVTAHPYKLVVGLVGSLVNAKVAATNAAAYTLQKNGANIGTVNIAAGANTATYTFDTETQFDAGDIIELIAPAVQDATLSGVSVTLAGTRVTIP